VLVSSYATRDNVDRRWQDASTNIYEGRQGFSREYSKNDYVILAQIAEGLESGSSHTQLEKNQSMVYNNWACSVCACWMRHLVRNTCQKGASR